MDKTNLVDYNKIFKDRFNLLNKKQKEAVESTDGPVIVIAGPGSGKTELLSVRVANIIFEGLARPENILCLTFTESASQNMLDRLSRIIGATAYKVPIFTFHSFCTHLISRYPEYFFDAHRFEPISELKQNEILSDIFSKLRYGSPLFARHEEKGYAYFKDVKSRIKNFKEAGLTPDETFSQLSKNKSELDSLKDLLEKIPQDLRSKESKNKFLALGSEFLASGTEVGKFYADFISKGEDNLSKVKLKLFEKDDNEKYIFKEEKSLEKLFAVCEIYKEYQKRLWEEGFFDFDDMILYVKDKLENNITLRAEVEETYQYVLVDEFQDTNLAQLKLIKSITSNPVLEGKANVFVVGDDDQSIYKFQGAELNNLFNFEKMYKDVKTIVLTENYRSTQKILDFSKEMIEKASERLVKINENFSKELISKNEELQNIKTEIYLNSFEEKAEENLFIAKKIKELISEGVSAKEIAIISRKHSQLQEILPYLDSENVSYNYERKESVFDQKHIEPLIKICKFLESVISNKNKEADDLLPEILSYEFLEIDRLQIWEISKKAYEENKSWLDVMKESEDEKIKELAKFFIELGLLSKTTSLEIILDILIGSKDFEISNNENEDDYIPSSLPKIKSKFVSNYKDFYFGEESIKENLAAYIHFLSSLRVFIYALREYKKGEKLLVSDLSLFIKLHKDYDIPLLNKTAFVGNKEAVNLLTAHKAKGLEFEVVFLIGLEEKTWKSEGFHSKVPLPLNMPFNRIADTDDDFLRLFFVGLTRAKHIIYMTHTDEIISFLTDQKQSGSLPAAKEKIDNLDLKNGLKVYNIPPFAKNEKALLEKILENYKLSPTHLNNFLDITKGGPKKFLEQNILLFPQKKTLSGIYGSAMHKTIEELYKSLNIGKNISIKEINEFFIKEIKKARLLEDDEKDLLQKGIEKLENFYNKKIADIKDEAKKCETEIDFKDQGVEILGAEFTGKIDRLKFLDDEYLEIVDLKSGKAFKNFDIGKAQKEDYENIKKHNYFYQLMFYKILLENSRRFSDKKIKIGKIVFIDDDNISELEIDFEKDIMREEYLRFKNLIINIFKIIKDIDSLQKLDISKYKNNVEGILEFEEDILKYKI